MSTGAAEDGGCVCEVERARVSLDEMGEGAGFALDDARRHQGTRSESWVILWTSVHTLMCHFYDVLAPR